MPVKSIIDVQVNDAAFNSFAKAYSKYAEQLKDSPSAWANVTKEIGGTRDAFSDLVALQVAMVAREELLSKARAEADRLTKSQALQWRDMAASSKAFLGNVVEATRSLLRWASLTSVVGGLLGAGGLFGIDRLAVAAGSARRSAQGLNLTTGEQRAFGVNFGRVVDANSFLSNVSDVLHDQSLRYVLYGAGLSEKDVTGKDTAQVGAAMLSSIKGLVDRTPDSQLVQVLQARGLNNVISLEEAIRLKSLSSGEFAQLQSSYNTDRNSIGFTDRTAKAWQDFATQMDRAGQKIEAVLVDKLSGLAGPLTDLSDSFTKAISSLANSGKLKEWIEDLGQGIEYAAKYLGSDEFQQDVREFVSDMEALAKAVYNGLHWLGIIPDHAPKSSASPGGTWQGPQGPNWSPGGPVDPLHPWRVPGAANQNNPGNMRPPGQSTGFQTFGSRDDGIRALASQLQRYEDVYGLDTIRKIAYRYAPPGENDTEAWIKNVSKASGLDPNAHLNLHDQMMLARLEAGVTRAEGRPVGASVIITILNNTGGSAVVSASQVAR